MSKELKLKDGVIREESNHLIISMYKDLCTVNVGISYFALFQAKCATDYIIAKIDELQMGQMSWN